MKYRECVTSGFSRVVYEICALLGYYVGQSGSAVPTFQDNKSGPIFKGQEIVDFLTLEDGAR